MVLEIETRTLDPNLVRTFHSVEPFTASSLTSFTRTQSAPEATPFFFRFLQENRIRALPDGMFSVLTKLKVLWVPSFLCRWLSCKIVRFQSYFLFVRLFWFYRYLNNNSIERLTQDSLRGLTFLETLWVNFTVVVFLCDVLLSTTDPFTSRIIDQAWLRLLGLWHKTWYLFAHYRHLQGNNIIHLDPDAFQDLRNLKRL